ncbi:helix-turn-helix transcriptional regulator [Miniimonas arenae]|uniref:Helix-turn-helix transcriptional regulator n=2 Tax=Miniimonas arenae TaxID=676201 RepID=A0A5C5BAJ5_9MICO|nr:helix-turn-helix transcriptional regulator [Miniimonas arenae]
MDELAQRPDQTLFEICSRLVMNHAVSISRQGVSQHLDVLERAGLVRTERRGRYKLHTLTPAPLERITTRWPPTGSASPPPPSPAGPPPSPPSPQEHP